MFKDIDQAFAWVESFTNLEKNTKEIKRHYRQERMNEVLEHFGNPHLECRVIHVAGSKGKGSTSALLSSALTQNGWKTGLYTSPHVCHYRERIQIDGRSLPDEKYIRCIEEIQKRLHIELPGGTEPTTFEILTLMSFLLFLQEGCDYCVIETGLGGRLDATNAVMPLASVLTPVELEHTLWLGNTLEQIATEKAGIIKKGMPVFSSPQKPEVEKILRDRAKLMESDFYYLPEKLETIAASVTTRGTDYTITRLKDEKISGHLSMIGEIQSWNAALALEVLEILFPEIPRQTWLDGFSRAYIPARMELLGKEPLFILDGSHTVRSVSMALDDFTRLSGPPENRVLIFACQDDKNPAAMAEVLAPAFPQIIITVPGFFKKSDPRRVYEAFSRYSEDCILEEDPATAYRAAMDSRKDLLVTGSFFLAGVIKEKYHKD
ncbi:MAG: bifunctional folylpolyglutamate synthase/dihydrofolate synthase [Spirochaetales bacterium]|nr:bifunctional folylpolyglutamate synthase/dihydrofolate synthase [Spirochaetales bacterium]